MSREVYKNLHEALEESKCLREREEGKKKIKEKFCKAKINIVT